MRIVFSFLLIVAVVSAKQRFASSPANLSAAAAESDAQTVLLAETWRSQ